MVKCRRMEELVQPRREGKRPPRESWQTLMFFMPYVRRVESSNGFQATPYVYSQESSSRGSNGRYLSGQGGGGDEAVSRDRGGGVACRDEVGGASSLHGREPHSRGGSVGSLAAREGVAADVSLALHFLGAPPDVPNV